MSYLESYKRLEKLCGDIMADNRCISAYIEEMENTPWGSRYVSGWDEDLKQLKHYRRVRNKIVHEPSCTEESMCGVEDVRWVETFHARILNGTDPLTLYRKVTQDRRLSAPIEMDRDPPGGKDSEDDDGFRSAGKPVKAILALLLMMIVYLLIVLWWMFER